MISYHAFKEVNYDRLMSWVGSNAGGIAIGIPGGDGKSQSVREDGEDLILLRGYAVIVGNLNFKLVAKP